MRSLRDRIRHALLFELVGVLLVMPLGAWAFGLELHEAGLVALAGSALAALWNLAYNRIFDGVLLRLTGRVRKTPVERILHAVLFEAGLLAALLPFVAWTLGVTLAEALAMEIALALFFLVHAFVFNWIYDALLPPPEPQG